MNNSNQEIIKLQKEIEKLKKENIALKKKKKFGLVWEDREREKNIDDGEYYPYLVQKGDGFGFDNGDNNKNILIEGDNYHALEILQYTHKDKIDVIYIDPPYNTGKKNEFKYGDRWIDMEDGYKHSYWLSFMNKRLRLAKSLLSKEGGVIFISIDDNEQARLKLLCDDIFGNKNEIGTIIHNKMNSKSDTLNIQRNHEYLLCYCKKIATDNKPSLVKREVKIKEVFKDGNRFYMLNDPITTRGDGGVLNKRKNLGYTVYYNPKSGDFLGVSDYDIEAAKTSNNEDQIYSDNIKLIKNGYIKIRPPKVRGKLGAWTWSIDKFNSDKDEILIKKTKTGYNVVKRTFVDPRDVREIKNKYYILNNKEVNSKSIIDFSTSDGTKQLNETMDKSGVFTNPKNINLLKYILSLHPKENLTVLDFFAGSGTTGQAIEELKKDEASHIKTAKYILCTNNENNICEDITYLRLKKSNEKYNYDSNLEYLKTELLRFDPEKHSDLDIKEFMVDKLTEIIKMRESCFKLDIKNKYLQKFNKDNKSVYILHDIYKMNKNDYEQVIEILNRDSRQDLNIYILSMSNHNHYANKISKAIKSITFEPLPESFLKVLRKIQRKQK